MFDVIVCGAGPAGAMASITLSRAGARVLLLDRATFPRDKMCGDTVNPGALSLLRPTGVLEELAGVSAPINGMVVTGENAVRVRCPYRGGEQGLTVLRRDLDLALVRAAAAAGTRVEEGVLVRGPLVDGRDGLRVSGVILAGRDGRDLRVPAPLVIAADGRRSRIAFALGLARHPARPRRWAIGAYYEGVTGLSTFGEMHVRRGWYFGVAPVPGGRANLCLVMPQLRPGGLRAPLALLERITSSDPQLTDRFAQAVRVTRPVVLGPLAVDARSAGLDGLLLAGDAAGFIDPMTGDGLRFALRGGELSAQAAMLHLAGTTRAPHDWLAHARRREFAGKWRFNRGLRLYGLQPIQCPSGRAGCRRGAGAARPRGGVRRRSRDGRHGVDTMMRGLAIDGLLTVVAVAMLAEARIAARHDRILRAAGAREPADDVYRWMQVVYPGAFVAFAVEGWWRGVHADAVLWAGVVVFAAAKALKYWAIATLGTRWTFRVLVPPASSRTLAGPYRWIRHPNYIAVAGELAGAAIGCHAWISGPIGVAWFGALMWRRIVVEERALGLKPG